MRNCLYEVSIAETLEILFAQVADSLDKNTTPCNVFMHGTMGIGKSTTIQTLAKKITKELGIETEVIDIRLGAMDASDVQGIPFVDRGEQTNMRFSTPEWWPRDESKFYILFLDEFSNASKEVMKAAYRLVLDRSVQNGSVLPTNVLIVGAGNCVDDGTGARELLPALGNRFHVHLKISTDKARDEFPLYAYNAGFHMDIVSFLNYKKERVVGKPLEIAFETPRSWEAVDRHLKNNFLSGSMLEKCVCGAIGSSVGSEFFAYTELRPHLPNFDKIISGEEKFRLSPEINIQFYVGTPLTYRIISELRQGNKDAAKTLITECMYKYSDDMKIIMIRMLKAEPDMVNHILTFEPLRVIFDQVKQYVK
jgi:hypothetical protein